MTKRPDHDHGTPETAFLPFAPGELDRCGLRLTRAEFARFMGVSKQAAGEWVTSGKITLGTDGRLDPRMAVSQLLRNSDPARLRARVLAPLVRDMGTLQKRIAEIDIALAAAKEDAEFHEGAAMELAGQLNGLQRRLQEECAALTLFPSCKVIAAIVAWLGKAEDAAGDIDLGVLDCLSASDAERPESTLPGALEKKNGEGELADG
ncbi:MAG: hypothetical protein Q7U07_01580 [Gammaproteobacteria bacterium]|nr:hypothetical protein [Gammaproteobacteria bacterium]